MFAAAGGQKYLYTISGEFFSSVLLVLASDDNGNAQPYIYAYISSCLPFVYFAFDK